MSNLSSKQEMLLHPLPQRANPFIFPLDEEQFSFRNTQDSPVPSLEALARPVSAPIPHSPPLALLNRPISPFSRVTNPMVRDKHFRKGFLSAHVMDDDCIAQPRPFKKSSTNKFDKNNSTSRPHQQ